MRYLGSKVKLLESIDNVIQKYNIKGDVFGDLFAGTGCVGDYFKDKYSIISNDFLYSSYVLNKAKILNSKKPLFEIFYKKYQKDIFNWLNEKNFQVNEGFFIYYNYTPAGERMFFTEENGIRIDGIRITIEELFRDKLITDNEYYYLLASLLESITKVSNTSGTYEAFFKFWDSRALKKLELEPLELNEVSIFEKNKVYNKETNELIREIKGDIAYIDPPYTVTQYISAYHMLETVAKYDFPEIKGIGGKRERGKKNSLYAQKSKVKVQFEDLLRQINFKHILISYSNQGLIPLNELIEIAKKFAVNGIVNIETFDYKEYKNHRSSNKRNGQKLNEVIIYFEKDLNYVKSPLNYSGSKDTLLPAILKELPPNVETFVDVMGGAFNVGANVRATKEVIYNELNPYVYSIISWMLSTKKTELITSIENVIENFSLNKGAEKEYLNLRNHYNNQDSSPVNLYVLHMYAFQNMIRFNNSQKFNTPIGVAGYSDDIKKRIENFKVKAPKVSLYNMDYVNLDWNKFPQNTVFYFDPPYFITSAAYNDGKRGMKGWNAEQEAELLNILTKIHALGYKFMLSNVLYHKDKTNHLLLEWIQEHNYKVIDIGISGARYAKKEVIIKNF